MNSIPPGTQDGPVSGSPQEVPSLGIENMETPEGRQLGGLLSGYVDAEVTRDPTLRPRCYDCAFLKGRAPNGMAATLMNALKCVIEREPFWCHLTYDDGKERLCAGWEALMAKDDPAGIAPWPFIDGQTDPSVIQMGQATSKPAAQLPDEGSRDEPRLADRLEQGNG